MPTPSDRRNLILEDFIGLRDSLREHRIGHGGREVCSALTEALDAAVAGLIDPDSRDMTVVALGGYGRREMSPYSDVDLMLLHEVDDASEAAAELFRPLWDAKLRVGHSVRTVREAAVAARERFDNQTTLLTSRLVAGSAELFDRLMEEVSRVTRARPLRRHLVAAERQRRLETPYQLMAADLKTGRGGLRTLQGFDWERRREGLIGRFSTDSQPEEESAKEVLLEVRNALHVTAGRAHDTFSPELREPVARWLGSDVFETAGELVAAMHTIDRLAERRWPEVIEERAAPIHRRVWNSIARQGSLPVSDSRPTIDDLVWMLGTGEEGRAVFDRMWEDGLLQDMLPEWDVVSVLPQLEPFHEHPVAPHLWRTVAEMRGLIEGAGHLRRVADDLGDTRLLLLAAFLHDIGKGHGGDHAGVGADIAADFSSRMGLDEVTAERLVGAVSHHLLLPLTATRRDLDDPAVVDEVASLVGSLEMLQTLYLLTVADSRATGPSMWSEWKATLLRTLYLRAAARFDIATPALASVGTSLEDVLAGAQDVTTASEHVQTMPDGYLRSVTADDVVWHLELITTLDGASNLGVRTDEPIETAVVVGHPRAGFRQIVAAAFAANGIDVLEARLFSRADGLIVDSFRVRDDRTAGRVLETRWASVRSDLEAGLLGDLDTESKVATRAAAYPPSALSGEKPSVTATRDAASGDLVLVVKCSDRIGRLAEVLAVLGECGLDIRLAKLDSREGEVIDTFHVSGDSSPGPDPGLEERIAAAIAP